MKHTCTQCGEEFTSRQPQAKFCSDKCKKQSRCKPEKEKTCLYCGEVFKTPNAIKKYCDSTCSQKHRDTRNKEVNRRYKIPAHHLGTWSELVVACDLMKNGYHVFRPVAQSSPVDLIIAKGKELLKVEVKTGRVTAHENGKVSLAWNRPSNLIPIDIIAVQHDQQVFYFSHNFKQCRIVVNSLSEVESVKF